MVWQVFVVVAGLAACRPVSGTRVPVASCPGGPPVRSQVFELSISGTEDGDIGVAGGVSWLLGTVEREQVSSSVLAHLDRAGGLAITPVDISGDIAAVHGDRIWIYSTRPELRWRVVDVADPDAPVIGPAVPLAFGEAFHLRGVPAFYASGFAVGERRALLVGSAAFVMVDPATGVAVAPPGELSIRGFDSLAGGYFYVLHTACGVERCMTVGLDAGRLSMIRVNRDGTAEAEALWPTHVREAFASRLGAGVLVGWVSGRRIHLRTFDREGRTIGRSSLRRGSLREPTVLTGLDAVMFAARDEAQWYVAAVGANATRGRRRRVPSSRFDMLHGIPLADGLALVGVGHGDRYAELGLYRFARLPTRAIAGFVPSSGREAVVREVASSGADDDAALSVWMLARPGGAAALLAWRERGAGSPRAQSLFVPLRVPCRFCPVRCPQQMHRL